MALRWILGLVGTQIVPGQPDDEVCSEEGKHKQMEKSEKSTGSGFQMPLHYPRYKKDDYERMEEWRLDVLLREYGLTAKGSLVEKRSFAMGAFLWPDQL